MSKPSAGMRALIWFSVFAKFTKLVKLTKFVKLAKPLITVVSMSISAIVYAFWLGPWFSIGLVSMLFIHEMGHVVAMKARGYKASAPVFIPFLGAAIFGPRMTDRNDEAFIGIGGPAIGGLAAAVTFGAWFFINDKTSNIAIVLLMTSYTATFLNVFNLIPIRPLDGGRVTQAIGEWFKYVGVVALGVFSMIFREPVILFVWILVMPEITFLHLHLRATIAELMWIAMIVLMMMGYSNQPLWVDIMDSIIAGVLTLGLIGQASTDTDLAHEDDNRPQLEPKKRIGWFIRYSTLTVILGALFLLQIQYLPALK